MSLSNPTNVIGQDTEEQWERLQVVNLENITFSHPALIDFNPDPPFADEIYDIIMGSNSGNLLYQKNSAENNTFFDLEDDEQGRFSDSFSRAAVSSIDYNNDNFDDILVGDASGSIYLYLSDDGVNYIDNSTLVDSINVDQGFAKPVAIDMNIDGVHDIVVGDESGIIHTFINRGTWDNPDFVSDSSFFGSFSYGSHVVPFPIDPDNDGIPSFIVGTENSGITFLQAVVEDGELVDFDSISTGNSANPFDLIPNLDQFRFITSSMIDLNEDGFEDLIFGSQDGSVNIFINPEIDLSELSSGFTLVEILLIIGVIIVIVIPLTIFIVRRIYQKRGKPLFLMVIQDIGIAPFEFKFPRYDNETQVQDSNLAGGAFTGIQSIINEITSSDLNSFEAGENRILITRFPFPSFDGEVQVLLWSTEDDTKLRELSTRLAEYIATNLESNFTRSYFDDTFRNVTTSKIKELFSSYF